MLKNAILSKLLIILMVANFHVEAQVAAFYGAEGGGAESLGGRGGKIIEVTNLNDAGPGSLREACQSSGARIVVFKVAGIIDLKDLIYIGNPYITIAGQTAPGGGITLRGTQIPDKRGYIFYIESNNIVIRYLRIRLGYNSNFGDLTGKNIVLSDNSYNVIIDHCSMSWAQDKNFSLWGYDASKPIKNVTIQNTIIAEPIEDQYRNATGLLIGGGGDDIAKGQTNLDVHHNFFCSNRHRNPLFKGGTGRIINNIVYNYRNYGMGWEGGAQIDFIGNSFKDGPNPSDNKEIAYRDDPDRAVIGNPSIYIMGNKGPFNPNPLNDNWVMIEKRTTWQTPGVSLNTALRRQNQLPALKYPIMVHTVAQTESDLIAHVGASKRLDENGNFINNRDAVDTRQINTYINNTGKFLTSLKGGEVEVGGYPTIASGTAYTDTDKDGMPDNWEKKYGFNPSNLSDGNEDFDKDGYTNIEEFLNGTNPKEVITDSKVREMANQIYIYPNPAQNLVTIAHAPIGSEIKLLDLQGRELISQKATSEITELNIQALPQGLYMLKVGNVKQKLTVE